MVQDPIFLLPSETTLQLGDVIPNGMPASL
jgi:hypothetical protein